MDLNLYNIFLNKQINDYQKIKKERIAICLELSRSFPIRPLSIFNLVDFINKNIENLTAQIKLNEIQNNQIELQRTNTELGNQIKKLKTIINQISNYKIIDSFTLNLFTDEDKKKIFVEEMLFAIQEISNFLLLSIENNLRYCNYLKEYKSLLQDSQIKLQNNESNEFINDMSISIEEHKKQIKEITADDQEINENYVNFKNFIIKYYRHYVPE